MVVHRVHRAVGVALPLEELGVEHSGHGVGVLLEAPHRAALEVEVAAGPVAPEGVVAARQGLQPVAAAGPVAEQVLRAVAHAALARRRRGVGRQKA
jgi:hypothetical protein